MIDHARKLIFVHIARTGGTSIEEALMGRDWWKIDPDSKHLSASQTRQLYGDDVWQRYTKFSVVRNPWDRLVSMWATGWWWSEQTHLDGQKPTSLQQFIATLRPHPHERYEALHYHQILDEPLDAILRFETLVDDFATLLARCASAPIALPHAERRERAPYRDYYDAQSRDLVMDLFARDIADYKYSF
jgi:hypothetical protein